MRQFLLRASILMGILLGCSGPAIAGSDPLAPGKLTWIINFTALKLLQDEPDGGTLSEAYFDHRHTYVLVGPKQIARVPGASIPTISVKSYRELKQMLDSGTLDPGYGAILYDCENWKMTPDEEQQHPAGYYSAMSALIRAYNAQRPGQKLTFLAAPGSNLSRVLLPDDQGPRFQAFLKTGVIGPIAAAADIYEIQSQGAIFQLDDYVDYVTKAAAQARAANPKVKILAGLSTNPNGKTVTADQLFAAVLKTKNVVDGYWLNIPQQSEHCPNCGEPKPEVALDLLRKMEAYRE